MHQSISEYGHTKIVIERDKGLYTFVKLSTDRAGCPERTSAFPDHLIGVKKKEAKSETYAQFIRIINKIPTQPKITMISKVDILRNYHDQAIIVTLANEDKSLSGRIVDDTPDDHCVLVKDPDVVQYYDTRDQSLLEVIYFKDVTAIEYQ